MKFNFIFLVILILHIDYIQSFNKKIKDQDYNQDYDYSKTVELVKQTVQNQQGEFYQKSYERLAYLVDTYGPRLWGSQQLEMVIDELYQMGKESQLDNVKKVPVVNFTKWVRKEESLTLYDPRPYPQDLKIIGLGKSVPGDVKAEVLVVTSFEDLELRKEQVKGKIVCYSVEWEGYENTVKYRKSGAVEAAKLGAVGCLVRSMTGFSIESPHTGSMYYIDGIKKIPAAAISVEDANMFLRMRERGQKIVVHLKMDNEEVPNQTSYNVVVEIVGTEFPEEVIIFGGHMDSWDTGSQTGANDDGGGFITCFEALRVISSLGLKPKRTMRFIGWSGEEYGGDNSGAWQYYLQNQDDIGNYVLAFESDLGSTTPYGFGFTGNQEANQIVESIIKQSFKSIDCTTIQYSGTMVDTRPYEQNGVPTMKNLINNLGERDPYYFAFHHSAGDSMDIMDPDQMDLNVIAIASMMYIIADISERLPLNQ